MDAYDSHQSLVFDDMIVLPPATAATVSRIAPFLDFHERRMNRQPRMRKDAREMHQFMEQIKDAAALGAQPPRNFISSTPDPPDKLLADDNWLYDHDAVRFQQ